MSKMYLGFETEQQLQSFTNLFGEDATKLVYKFQACQQSLAATTQLCSGNIKTAQLPITLSTLNFLQDQLSAFLNMFLSYSYQLETDLSVIETPGVKPTSDLPNLVNFDLQKLKQTLTIIDEAITSCYSEFSVIESLRSSLLGRFGSHYQILLALLQENRCDASHYKSFLVEAEILYIKILVAHFNEDALLGLIMTLSAEIEKLSIRSTRCVMVSHSNAFKTEQRRLIANAYCTKLKWKRVQLPLPDLIVTFFDIDGLGAHTARVIETSLCKNGKVKVRYWTGTDWVIEYALPEWLFYASKPEQSAIVFLEQSNPFHLNRDSRQYDNRAFDELYMEYHRTGLMPSQFSTAKKHIASESETIRKQLGSPKLETLHLCRDKTDTHPSPELVERYFELLSQQEWLVKHSTGLSPKGSSSLKPFHTFHVTPHNIDLSLTD